MRFVLPSVRFGADARALHPQRQKWVISVIATAAVIVLVVGLVIWAPWQSPRFCGLPG
jgi:cytochrome b subunit of formate dehydrogenase